MALQEKAVQQLKATMKDINLLKEQEMQEMKTLHDKEVATLKEEHATAIDKQTTDKDIEINNLKTLHAQEITKLQDKLAAFVATEGETNKARALLLAEHSTALKQQELDMKTLHDTQMAKVKEDHATARGEG